MKQNHGNGARYSAEFKKEVVKFYITSGETMSQVAEKYSIAELSLSRWYKKFGEEVTAGVMADPTATVNKRPSVTRVFRSEEFKRKVVSHYVNSNDSMEEVAEKFSVPQSSLSRWYIKFANETTSEVVEVPTKPEDKAESYEAEEIPETMSKKEQKEQEERKRLIKDLTIDNIKDASPEQLEALLKAFNYCEEELKQSKEVARRQEFRADLNEKMIQIAELKYNVEITKKASTKH